MMSLASLLGKWSSVGLATVDWSEREGVGLFVTAVALPMMDGGGATPGRGNCPNCPV